MIYIKHQMFDVDSINVKQMEYIITFDNNTDAEVTGIWRILHQSLAAESDLKEAVCQEKGIICLAGIRKVMIQEVLFNYVCC